MNSNKIAGSPTIIPGMRYKDAPAAIRWLGEAFGFEAHLVVPDDAGGITHAQLTFGAGMIMLGSQRPGEDENGLRIPLDAKCNTRSVYVRVSGDLHAHCERASAAGAKILLEVTEQHYGGHLYTCTDPEGHLWNFGTYDPWAEIR